MAKSFASVATTFPSKINSFPLMVTIAPLRVIPVASGMSSLTPEDACTSTSFQLPCKASSSAAGSRAARPRVARRTMAENMGEDSEVKVGPFIIPIPHTG